MGKPRFVQDIITKRIYRRKIRNLRIMLEDAKRAKDIYAHCVIDAQIQVMQDFLKRCYNYEV